MNWNNLKNGYYKLLRSKYLLPLSDTIGRETRIEDGYIFLGGNKILECGEFTPQIGETLLTNYSDINVIGSYDNKEIPMLNTVMLPGFIKTHGHDHESPIIGVSKDTPLTTWLDEAVNFFTGFLMEEKEMLVDVLGVSPYLLTYVKAKADDIGYGITTSMTHHCNFNKYHVEELVKANEIAGTNNIIAVGSQDRNYDERILDIPHDIAVERVDEYFKEFDNNKDHNLQIIPGPDQFFSNGPEILKGLKEWSRKNDKLFHIHSSEEPATTKWFIEEIGNGLTPVEYGESIGVLDENSVLAHQVNNTPNDLEILKRTKTKIVHNPLANTILGSGMPPIIEMLDMGIDVTISTDGSGSSDNQNILNAARVASQYQKAINQNAKVLPAQEVLEKITIDAARMLRLDEHKGSLDVGKDADVILINLEDHMNMTPTLKETVVENLIWASNGNEVSHVISGGEILMEDYKIKVFDDDLLKDNVRKLTKLFFKYRENAKAITGTGVHQ